MNGTDQEAEGNKVDELISPKLLNWENEKYKLNNTSVL